MLKKTPIEEGGRYYSGIFSGRTDKSHENLQAENYIPGGQFCTLTIARYEFCTAG
jgi:hypothetical protein